MIRFDESDRVALKEASELLDALAGSGLSHISPRAAYLSGRLAGLSGRIEIEDEETDEA